MFEEFCNEGGLSAYVYEGGPLSFCWMVFRLWRRGGGGGVGFCSGIGKNLLCRMLWIFSSRWYSAVSNWWVFRRLYGNLTSACICGVEWFEVCGMMESVKVGFLWMEILIFVRVLWMAISK